MNARDPSFDRELLASLPALRRYALFMECDRHLADDLVQETVCRALEHHAVYRIGTGMKAWLGTMAHNLRLTRLRREANWGNRIAYQYGAFMSDVRSGGQEECVELREAREFMLELPVAMREILAYAERQYSYDEMATLANVPGGTAKSRMTRARRALTEAMAV